MPGSEIKIKVTSFNLWTVVISHFPVILSCQVLCQIQKRDRER